jgi:branched-chain amino acid aminotransferase
MPVGVLTFEAGTADLQHLREDASLAAASAALPRGAYSSLRTYGGDRVLRFADHLARLRSSVEGGVALGEDRLATAMRNAIAAGGHAESRLRVTWAPPRLFVTVEPFTPLPIAWYERGVAAVTIREQRAQPHAKDTAFITTAAARYAALPPGAHEGLMVAADGSILEGLSSNVFFVAGDVLRTEEERVLPGVTRSIVLDLASGLAPVELRALALEELPAARECFITSASREVLPVVVVDGRPIGDGRPGPVARELRERFARAVEREARPV